VTIHNVGGTPVPGYPLTMSRWQLRLLRLRLKLRRRCYSPRKRARLRQEIIRRAFEAGCADQIPLEWLTDGNHRR
jgi:hypothetical protein